MKNTNYTNYTKIYATRVGPHLVFKCSWCGQIHKHGIGDGPRASHCPKHKEDYEIIEIKEDSA